ncbi:hypothetical protein [Metaplanococcus flavidus]|uniref:Uncharacterized protein n=1 Tax=Metaplanococcus flavidus TaxID=569883 RepID=A0ABW3LB96_9BACL
MISNFPNPAKKKMLHFATPIRMEQGTNARTWRGTVKRIWVTFRTREGETLKQVFLYDPNFLLLIQLKNATIGQKKMPYNLPEMMGHECVIEVLHDYSGNHYQTTITNIFDKQEYVEEPEEGEAE